nr:phospholipid:diacylglycerol acyltransferase [Quercus suber]
MSELRRRIFGIGTPDSSPGPSRDASPAPIVSDGGKDYKIVPAAKLEKLNNKPAQVKGVKRRNVWVFVLGGLVGLLAAGLFASPTGSMDKIVELAGIKDMNLDSILDVLPVGFIKELRELQSSSKEAVDYDSFSIGLHAHADGVRAKHPVIMIPGVISTGLESWGTEEESRQYFRKRLWGSWSMMRALVLDKPSWKRHVMLDEKTGMDPPGIKLRAAQGFDAADFFITGYWIWNKILENLATIGYDPTNAFTAAYDWRMSYMNYEKRDQYFTRLKNHIQMAKEVTGLKVVLLSHSMGSQVLFYFFHWVEAEGYGNGGPTWVNDHVQSWINISGCMLGALKDLPAILSGEMRDTAQLNAFAVYGLERFLSRHERAEIFRHMPGISSMLPMGGEAVNGSDSPGNLTIDQSVNYLWAHTEKWYVDQIQEAYSLGVAHSKKAVEENNRIPAKWINPLESSLPNAPDMKIFCFYGMGKPTERAYYYREDSEASNISTVAIDTTVGTASGFVDRGVVMGEGDGTVNLMSTGYMCNKGWKINRYNPAKIPITVVEMPHEPDRFSPRGGPNTGDHVDILGRSSLNDLILRVAGGRGDLITDYVVSNITTYADRVKIYEDDSVGA